MKKNNNWKPVTGIDVTPSHISADNKIDELLDDTEKGVHLWGHRIILNGDDSIECAKCNETESMPELLQMTTGYRQSLFKMYLLGKFRDNSCQASYESDNSVLRDNVTNVSYDPNYVHWTNNGDSDRTLNDSVSKYVPQNTRIIVDGEEWEHDGRGRWHSLDRPDNVLTSKEMHHQHGDVFHMKLTGTPLGQQTQSMRWNPPTGDLPTKSDDRSSLNADVDDDLDEDEKKSLKDKFVSALSEGKTTLR